MSTASRHVDASTAYAAVRHAVRAVPASSFLYKKTDSLLRGNIASEIQPALDGAGASTLVYTPAFPSGGRTTECGTLALWGTPVAEADPGRDPVTPVLESHIPTLIESTSELKCRVISTHVVRSGASALADALRAAREARVNVILPDIAEDCRFGIAWRRRWTLPISCASAPDRQAWRRRWRGAPSPHRNPFPRCPGLRAPSPSSGRRWITRSDKWPTQWRRSRSSASRSEPDRTTSGQRSRRFRRLGKPAASALVDAVIPSEAPTPAAQDLQHALLPTLSRLTIWRGSLPMGLVLSGGDRARAALAAIPAEAIELAGEIGWGVPYGVFASGPGAGWPVVTKAGVMGGPSALADALRTIGHP